jgi:NAD(P)-dependent dehydrogenase (short-subunit alcohol dehydrogenase family)
VNYYILFDKHYSQNTTNFMSPSPVIIITGASKGIGRAAVLEALVQFDAKVVAIARNEPLLQELSQYVLDKLNKRDQFEFVAGDVTDEAILRQAVNVAVDKWGRLDSVIANAGYIELFIDFC